IPRRRGARQRESASLMRIRFSLPLWLLFLYWYPEKRDSTARLRVRLGGAHVRGEGLERGDIAVDVLLLVGYGEGPLLLHPRRHEDAVVHVVEPGESGELAIDLGEVIAVLVDPLGREDHAALGADSLRVGRQAVLVDHLLAAGFDGVVARPEL